MSVMDWMKEKLNAVEIEGVVKDNLLNTAKSLFIDDPLVWLLQKMLFYLGQIPKIDPILSLNGAKLGEVFWRRLKSHIVSE